MHLDIDRIAPGLTGGQQHLVDRGGRVSRFRRSLRLPEDEEEE